MFWKKQKLDSFDQALTRERLIQSSRIVVIDDENPSLIEELKNEKFSVDHDKTGRDLHKIESQIYDVAILDYHGVAQWLGPSQGLELLKHIRRVSPRTRVIAYTSRSLSASESEFFRLSHAVLPKDLGLGDSLALVEDEIKKSFSKEHLYNALLSKLEISDEDEKRKLKKYLIQTLSSKDENGFKEYIIKKAGEVAEKSVDYLISRLFISK